MIVLAAVLLLMQQPEAKVEAARAAVQRARNDPDLQDELGNAQIQAGRYAEAEATFRVAIALRESAGNLSDPCIAKSLRGLGTALFFQGKPRDAAPLFARAVDLLDRGGEDFLDELLPTLYVQGMAAAALGDDETSDRVMGRVTAFNEALAKEAGAPSVPAAEPRTSEEALRANTALLLRPEVATDMPFEVLFSMRMMQAILAEESDPASADQDVRAASELAALHRGQESAEAGCAANALASFQRGRGRLEDAGATYRIALRLLDRQPGFELEAAMARVGIARIAAAARRGADARAAYEDAICALEGALTPLHPFVAMAQWELFRLEDSGLSQRQRTSLAQAAFRAFWITAPLLPVSRGDPQLRYTLTAGQYRIQEAAGCGFRLYNDSLLRSADIANDTAIADTLSQSAQTYAGYGGYSQAVRLLPEVIRRRRQSFGSDDYPLAVADLQQLAEAERGTLAVSAAAEHARQATALLDRRVGARSDPREALQARAFARGVYVTHVEVLFETDRRGRLAGAPLEESFIIGQKARASSTALTLESTAARFGAANAGLAALIRQYEDLSDEHRKIEGDLLKATGAPPELRDLAVEARLRQQLAADAGRLVALRQRIEREYPAYAKLVFAPPVSVAAVQQLLREDEALLAYVTGQRASFAWLVRRDRADAVRINLNAPELFRYVSSIRTGLQPDAVVTALAERRMLPSFDLPSAWTLDRNLVAPFAPSLEGVRHLFVVPDGPLEALPFSVLVTSEPKGPSVHDAKWLGAQLAMSVLPAVGSLAAVRRTASHAPQAFIGFGRPRARAASPAAAPRSGVEARLAKMRSLRGTADLAETQSELAAIAAALDAPRDALRLSERAGKAAILAAPLGRYRVIAFSTHALVTGEAGAPEPSLVLGSGAAGTEVLTAQEIATWKLDADLVLLLGCNTAASDEGPAGEALSGLARAFFHAGSRGVVVSHWAVPSEETTLLITRTFEELEHDRQAGMAESMRRAMVSLMTSSERPELAHPVFWAPFLLVGDGGPH